jgi:hypothetical protein
VGGPGWSWRHSRWPCAGAVSSKTPFAAWLASKCWGPTQTAERDRGRRQSHRRRGPRHPTRPAASGCRWTWARTGARGETGGQAPSANSARVACCSSPAQCIHVDDLAEPGDGAQLLYIRPPLRCPGLHPLLGIDRRLTPRDVPAGEAGRFDARQRPAAAQARLQTGLDCRKCRRRSPVHRRRLPGRRGDGRPPGRGLCPEQHCAQGPAARGPVRGSQAVQRQVHPHRLPLPVSEQGAGRGIGPAQGDSLCHGLHPPHIKGVRTAPRFSSRSKLLQTSL